MTSISTFLTAACAASLATALAGCSADAGDLTGDAAETTAETHDELSAAVNLRGAWTATRGSKITRIEFTRSRAATTGGGVVGQRFYATIDTGIRCIQAPCPSSVELDAGLYSVEGNRVTLHATRKPAPEIVDVLGPYRATVRGAQLTLSRRVTDASGRSVLETSTFAREPSTPQCVEYGTLEEDGTKASDFYAHEVPSIVAARELVASLDGKAQGLTVRAGKCSAGPTVCTREYQPVCATIVRGAESPLVTKATYGNPCTYAVALREAASEAGVAKGHVQAGECPVVGCATDADCEGQWCGFGEGGARICKPFAGADEPCGGFQAPENATRCAPNLACLAPQAKLDVGGRCVKKS